MANAPVVYVEDEEDYQRIVVRILEKTGYSVKTASTASEGLQLLEEAKPDLVMLDVNLPDGDGYSICKRLRQDPAWAKTPILMLTVRRRPEEWLIGFASGADDYVAKPLNPPELLERVQACLEGKGARTGSGPEKAEYQLIQAALAGNRGAFEVLITQYKDQLLGSIARLTRNKTEAEDIVSCTYMHAFERLKQFRGRSSVYSWLYGIALNDFYNRYRHESVLHLGKYSGEVETDWPAQEDPAFEALDHQPDLTRLKDVVLSVPEEYRNLLEWHLIEGIPQEDIAQRLSIPTGTVWSRMAKAKRLLRLAWNRPPGAAQNPA